jgi:predicted transcriptional regulator
MTDLRTLISSKIRIELLKILALNPESTFNINELSRRTGFSIRGVEKELKNLLTGGILRREVSGNQHLYQLDLRCPIYQEIKAIITKTVGLTALVKQALISVEKNVDLFIVSELSGLKLAELLGEVQNEIGRSINVSQFTADEFNQRKEQNDHFLKRVLEGPKIHIFGHIDEP